MTRDAVRIFYSCSFRDYDLEVNRLVHGICTGLGLECLNVSGIFSATLPEQARVYLESAMGIIAVATRRGRLGHGEYAMPTAVREEIAIAFGLGKPALIIGEEGVRFDGFMRNYGAPLMFARENLSSPEFIEKLTSSISSFASRESALSKLERSAQCEYEDEPRIMLVSATRQLMAALRRDLDLVHQIDPEQFELLVCDRLDAMGFEVNRVGHAFASDGGVDIVSWPKKSNFPYLIAVQVKHRRRPSSKVGPGPVKDLMAVLQTSPFDAGILVTNTSFTPDARWFAQHGPRILRLRDLQDLRGWIAGNFLTGDLRDLPEEIELAPGVIVRIH